MLIFSIIIVSTDLGEKRRSLLDNSYLNKKDKILLDFKDKRQQRQIYEYSDKIQQNQPILTLMSENDFELKSFLNNKSKNTFNEERLSFENSENIRFGKSIEDTKNAIDRTRLELRAKILDTRNEFKEISSKFKEVDDFRKPIRNSNKASKLSIVLSLSKISEIMDTLDSLTNKSIEEVSTL